MNKLIILALLVISIPFGAVAKEELQATSTSREAGLVPGDFFYFMDRFAENVKLLYTFNGESRARLSLAYAEERIAELGEKLEAEGIDSSAVLEARKNLDKEITRGLGVVTAGKTTEEVVILAKIVDQNIEHVRDSLKNTYRVYRESKEWELDARPDQALVSHLEDEILHVMNAEDDLEHAFEQEKQKLEISMGEKQSAESHIANALRARAQFSLDMTKATRATSSVVTDALNAFDEIMMKSNESFTIGDFESASEYAKDAKWSLNDARNEVVLEDLEKTFFERDASEEAVSERPERKGEPRGSR